MKREIKYWLILVMIIFYRDAGVHAACNLANGLKMVFEFENIAEGASKTEYGFDVEPIMKHISVEVNKDTFVRVKCDKNNDGIFDSISINTVGGYGVSSNNSEPTVMTPAFQGTQFQGDNGLLLKITGLSVGVSVLTFEGDQNGDACGSITVHVYNEKTIDNLSFYVEKGISSFDEKPIAELFNKIARPAVMRIAQTSVIADIEWDYDVNENSFFDYYVDGGVFPQAQNTRRQINPEVEYMLVDWDEATVPKVAVVKQFYRSYRLHSDVEDGDSTILVYDLHNSLSAGMGVIFAGENRAIESISNHIIPGLKSVTFNNPVTGDHTADNNNLHTNGAINMTRYDPATGSYFSNCALVGATTATHIIVHEILHDPLCGGLADLDKDIDASNVMVGVNGGSGVLRYIEQNMYYVQNEKERQWQKVQGSN